jgi:lysine 2,3-aminomutase
MISGYHQEAANLPALPFQQLFLSFKLGRHRDFNYIEHVINNESMKSILNKDVRELTVLLWDADPAIYKILAESATLEQARNLFFTYLADQERHYFNIYSDLNLKELHICERNNAKECIRVLKNIIRTENEVLTGASALKELWILAKGMQELSAYPEPGFIMEFIALFRGINGKSGITDEVLSLPEDHRMASQVRSRKLNTYAQKLDSSIKTIPKGTDANLVMEHEKVRRKILDYFGSSEEEWEQDQWQMKHIISDETTLKALVELSEEELEGLRSARENGIPFQITPYYLSLFNLSGPGPEDRAVRAQVLPGKGYCDLVASNRRLNVDMDFMGEQSTSPISGITRRYPQIVILKPIDTCPQLCVYCQRNWEMKPMQDGGISSRIVDHAVRWIRDNQHITEILITGGDPLMLPDQYLEKLLNKLADISHIERIRIGTRIPVTLPFRITDELVAILKRNHVFGLREVCLVTHFEHPTEITPEAIEAIRRIREAGMSIYNQQVFTYYNSRRYETSALRRALKLAGVDPYYSFNTKGKAETLDFRVPIARIQQERKEEARFLPGMVRTDEPVFNVPKLGKSHLRAWQDHEVIMITPLGERIYRFYPWESRVTFVDDYLYTDTPIFDYLKRLEQDQVNADHYSTIWFYF